MTTAPLVPALAVAPVIAILRSQSPRHFAATADALHAAGIRAMEFTLTTPGVLHALREYAESKPAGTALGAGTVMTPADAMRAVEAGATYLITPAICLDVIREARRLGVPVLPGALTPSEIVAAWGRAPPGSNSSPPRPEARSICAQSGHPCRTSRSFPREGSTSTRRRPTSPRARAPWAWVAR